MAETGPEIYEMCPYDKSHRVRRSILPMHLFKCAKNHNYSLVKCSFNSNHHVAQEELQEHEKNCPDRHSFEASFVSFKEENYLSIPVEHIALPPDSEDWDDGAIGGYDPKAVTNSQKHENFIVRMRPCLAPAERKAFRSKQCRDAKEFDEKKELMAPLKIIPSAKQMPLKYEPLRRPITAPITAMTEVLEKSLAQVKINNKDQHLESANSSAGPKYVPQVPKPGFSAAMGLRGLLCQAATRSPELKVPTNEVPKEQSGFKWCSSGRGKAIASMKDSMNLTASNVLPFGFGRGRGNVSLF